MKQIFDMKGKEIKDFDALMSADSVGKHYHTNIKGKFESVKFQPNAEDDNGK